MEEIQDKWRDSTFIVSQPSSCEEHFLIPPLFYSYQIYVWMNLRAPPLLLLFMDGVWALLAFWFSGVDTDNRRQSTSSDEWSLTPPANQGEPLSLDSTLLLPGQRLMSTDGFRSLDSQQCATRDRPQCSVADCQNPTACASKRCLHCQHFSVQLVHPCHTRAQRVQVDIDLCQACLQPGVENNRGLGAR